MIDGKKTRIRGEKMVGEISNRMADPDFSKDDVYFHGTVITPRLKRKDFDYYIEGTVSLTKEEFQRRVKTFSEVF
ncbi:MAG: hypothetical protein J6X11_09960 [Treponema sp.]|nr:hypothetical protein [Treponema sp.]